MDHFEEEDPRRIPQQAAAAVRTQQPPQPAGQWAQQQPPQQPAPVAQQGYAINPQQQMLGRRPQYVVGAAPPSEMAQTGVVAAHQVPPPQQPPPQDYHQRMPYPQMQGAAVPQYAGAYPPQSFVQQPVYAHQSIQQQQQQVHMPPQAAVPHQAVVPMMEHHPPPHQPIPQPQQPYVQPTVGRLPSDRPLVKLSVSLIDTYKQINKVYYEERDARRAARAAQKAQKGQGTYNNGYDDENYDYIITNGEMFYGRYVIKERIGKGSFGQVVRAVDTETQKDVAIKIIKSKRPFLIQAKTEIELLTHLCDKDQDDQHNIVRLLTHFMYRQHQCLVFEMLSLNLYELLKNTQFGGVSLNLIRKFAKQILKSLSFLARSDVDIIHCDLKPENILLRHPKRSGVKVIDFGSSCRSDKRMYSYIQSRFYRSPEVMLGLPYSVSIDMWSLGCILAEMHTGEPLFSGSDQFDQMQKIVKILGMVPTHMINKAGDKQRQMFFENPHTINGDLHWDIKQVNTSASAKSGASSSTATAQPATSQPKQKIVPSSNPIESLTEIICAESNKKKRLPSGESGNSQRNYELFVNLISKMLTFDPQERIKPEEALQHAFIRSGDQSQSSSPHQGGSQSSRRSEASSFATQDTPIKRQQPR